MCYKQSTQGKLTSSPELRPGSVSGSGLSGMTTHTEHSLLSLGPVNGWDFLIWSRPEGYLLRVMHHHEGGLFSDCGVDVYEHLVVGELLDVIDAVVSGLPPRLGR